MLINRRLDGSVDQIVFDFVEREATLEFLTKLSTQLHRSGVYFLALLD